MIYDWVLSADGSIQLKATHAPGKRLLADLKTTLHVVKV